MKKSLIALAALGAFAGSALAQSSVTLFGVADVAVRNVKNGSAGDVTSLSTNGNASSRLGFRGVEDLGGGLRAGFWLEGDVSYDVGGGPTAGNGSTANAQNWQRRATVSLMGGFGEVRLGRDYTPTFWNHTIFDPFGTNGVGNQLNIQATPAGAGSTTLVRANNSVGYFLPSGLGGLYGQAMVAAGEGTDSNKYYGGRLGWANGPINVAAAYGQTETTGANKLKGWNLGGSFNAGFATLMAQYHQYKQGSVKQTNWLLGANVPVGPGTFKISYAQADDNFEADQIAIGYVYDLSKRTALYAHYSQVDNDNSKFTASANGPSVANIAAGFKSTGYEFGIRHNF